MRQESFDPFNYLDALQSVDKKAGYTSVAIIQEYRRAAREMAKMARDDRYRQLKANGRDVTRFTLKNQLEQYRAFGIPGRGYRDVFYVQIHGEI